MIQEESKRYVRVENLSPEISKNTVSGCTFCIVCEIRMRNEVNKRTQQGKRKKCIERQVYEEEM